MKPYILRLLSLVNIYFERTPVVEPSAACPNPEARVSIMCGLYAESIVPRQISNFGQARGPVDENGEAFQVVISGSNGTYLMFSHDNTV
jgi:hypothetical protein